MEYLANSSPAREAIVPAIPIQIEYINQTQISTGLEIRCLICCKMLEDFWGLTKVDPGEVPPEFFLVLLVNLGESVE